MPQQHFYEFGPYRIDVALNRLERGGETIPLPPKAFDLLLLLARNADRVVGKAELMHALWPKTFVEEGNLTQHVYTLRKALGDRSTGQPYIETMARRGYRLAADVRAIAGGRAVDAEAEARAGPAAPPGTETLQRKPATVLYCTIANAAGLYEHLGSTGMHDVMRRLMDVAADELGRYEGVVSQQHADGFVAVFGAPVVHEDDGHRAVLAALAIQCRSRALPLEGVDSGSGPLELRIGIDSGPLVIGRSIDGRHGAYSVIGETMKIADLLQQFAEPGAILISDATRRTIEKYGGVDLAAGPSPPGIRAFRIVGASGGRRSQRPARALAPFVGRERELLVLEGLLAEAVSGNGQAVTVVGEPGMGKSRLLGEFTRPVVSCGRAAVLEGRSVSYGSSIPYLPLADILRALCGVADADSPPATRHAVDRVVAENGLPPDAGAWLQRLLGVSGGAGGPEPLSPEALKARTFDALRLVLLNAAGRRPLVLVVEDVHWIDRTSEEFLATLVGRIGAAPVLLVATHRPGYRASWLDRSYGTQITLSPLTAADSARLVGAVAREQPLDADVSQAILRRGEGNPFFLEELARAAIEHRAGTDTIPETVQGVIMARIDRLADVPKRMLQTASVVGREVPLRLLQQMWNGPADFDAGLTELCRLEFLHERTAGAEPAYVFKHALTQDVAYDSLLARTRAELHLRAAAALQTVLADRLADIAATLAYHYARTDRYGEAVTWLTRAADGAARVYANTEAILHLDLAARRLQRLPEGPERDRRMIEVALRQAHSLYFLGRFRESVDALAPHEARLARLADARLTADCSFWLAHMYARIGDPRRVGEHAQRTIDAATAADDAATLGKAYGVLATERYWAGRPEEGIAYGMRSIRLLERSREHEWWLGMSHFYVAFSHALVGDFEAALAAARRSDAVGRDMGDPRLQTYAGYMAGWVEASRGNHDEAVAQCRRSVGLAPDRVSRAYASLFLGYALLERGDCGQAQDVLRPILSELEGFPLPYWLSLGEAFTGETMRLQGRLEEAAGFAERGIQTATRVGYAYALGFAHRIAGRIARDRGSGPDAARELRRSLEIFERASAAFEAARTRLDLAAVAAERGDRVDARSELAAAARTFHSLGTIAYGSRVAALAASLGLETGT